MLKHSTVFAGCAGALAGLLAAGAAFAVAAPPHYSLDLARSALKFDFTQAGADNRGRFRKFTVDLIFADAALASSKLDVTVDMGSLDTGDNDRDKTLRGAQLFDAAKYPQAHYVATKFERVSAGRYEALGKLTIRNVTRDLKLPFSIRTSDEHGKTAAYMTGRVSIERLDFGVGQGDWKATDQVANEVVVSFNLTLPAG
jgi:polyisoprenoid-binding protein YceI